MTTVTFVVICRRKKNTFDVKAAFLRLLNRHKKLLQENMHKVSKQMCCFCILVIVTIMHTFINIIAGFSGSHTRYSKA